MKLLVDILTRWGKTALLSEAIQRLSLFSFHYNEEDQQKLTQVLQELKLQEVSQGVDPFGLDIDALEKSFPLIYLLYKYYFRVEVFGTNNIPTGPAVFIANHGGQLPLDAVMITAAAALSSEHPRLLRSMVEKWVPTLPFISELFQAFGQPTGTPENFRLLAMRGDSSLIFPEGVKGISKTFSERYKLKDFPSGFLKLAHEFSLPIVPVAIIGAEEQFPSLGSLTPLANLLRAPAFPITPFFPLLGPLGMIPLPTKYRIHFAPPISTQFPVEKIDEQVKKIRNHLQAMIYRGLGQRQHIFW